MAYIGSTPTSQNFTSGTDYFSGTGSQTDYTLTRTVNSVNDIEVVINNVVQQPSTAYTLSGTTITFTSAPSSGTNNIYVRYLATNMQSFTVPANSITRSQLDSDLQAGFQGRNRIINGAMTVAQRGTSTSIGTNTQGFSVDRFRCDTPVGAGVTSAQSTSIVPNGFAYSLSYTAGTGTTNADDQSEIVHFIEGHNIADLNWGSSNAKPIVLSFWSRSSLTGNFGLILENGTGYQQYVTTYSLPTANTWTYVTLNIPAPTIGTWQINNTRGIGIRWDMGVGTTYSTTSTNAWNTVGAGSVGVTGTVKLTQNTGATFYITGVQLEEGTTATSFEREAYSVTLQKCQRYYAKISGGGFSNYCGFATGFVAATTQLEAIVKYPVTMRASATLNYSNVRTNTAAGTNAAITSILASYAGTDSINATFNSTSSSMTLGQGGSIVGNNNSAAYLELSAEL